MIAKLAELIKNSVTQYSKKAKTIFWQDIPGYKNILKAFLLEMKELDILEYPDALVEASLSLLNNNELLSIFVHIAFKKTK